MEKTQRGSEIADQTSIALQEIVQGVTKVSDLIQEIATSSNDQAQGISQVNAGLGQIDNVIQQNTAAAEESADTSQQLSGQSAHLKGMLDRFSLKLAQQQLPHASFGQVEESVFEDAEGWR